MTAGTLSHAAELAVATRWWARREDARLLSGTAGFVADVTRKGQVFARVVRSDTAHGLLRGLRTEEAARLPGVLRVLTAADLDEVPRIPLRIPRPAVLERFLQPVLASDRVRYVGEPVALVVAESPAVAEDAAELVEVDVDPLPAALSLVEPHEARVWGETASDVLFGYAGGRGDVSEALRRADVVVSTSMATARDTGLPLETRGLVAEWSSDGTLNLWGPAKFVGFTRNTVALWFGISSDRVICHHVDVGGTFGVRGELYPEDFLIPWAASVVGAPVKWVEDLNEHLVAINHSRGQLHSVTAGAMGSGELVALRVECLLDYGAYARPLGGRVAELVVEGLAGPYRWKTLDLRCSAVATNTTPTGTMRGPATFDTTFVRERVLDLLAHRLGIDPVALRRRNLISHAELPYRQVLSSAACDSGPSAGEAPGAVIDPVHDVVYDSGDYHHVLDRLLNEVGFAEVERSVEARRRRGELVGYGIACFLEHSGIGREESVRLDLDKDGRICIFTTGSEIGQGLATMIARIGTEALGVDEDRIVTRTNETDEFDGGSGTFGSRSTIFVGSAIVDAARRLRHEGAQRLRAAGRVVEEDELSVDELLTVAPLSVVGRHEASAPTFGFGTHLAVVSVDPETGHVTVERLAVAYDCGRAIDLESVRGQLRGGAVQALGGTLYEELAIDANGQPQSANMMDFIVPTLTSVPAVEVVVVELPGTLGNPLGLKGAGEAGVMGVGGAVGNAVSHALGSDEAAMALPLKGDALVPFLPEMPPGVGARRSAPPSGPEAPERRRGTLRSNARAVALPTVGGLLAASVVVVIRSRRRRRSSK